MAPLTRLGVRLPTRWPGPTASTLDRLVALAGAAEDAGFDSLWVADDSNAVLDEGAGAPALEATTALGALAVRTSSVLLGALVHPAGQRPPAVLAKQVTALDVLSGGRAALGLGAGRGPTGDARRDVEELEDALRICRALFAEEVATVAGRRHQVEGAHNRPRPVRPGGPPIVVGGIAERATLPPAVALADGCNLAGPFEVLTARAALVRRLCEEAGRDPAGFTVTALVPVPHAGRPADVAAPATALLAAGIDGVVLDLAEGTTPEAVGSLGRALGAARPQR